MRVLVYTAVHAGVKALPITTDQAANVPTDNRNDQVALNTLMTATWDAVQNYTNYMKHTMSSNFCYLFYNITCIFGNGSQRVIPGFV